MGAISPQPPDRWPDELRDVAEVGRQPLVERAATAIKLRNEVIEELIDEVRTLRTRADGLEKLQSDLAQEGQLPTERKLAS